MLFQLHAFSYNRPCLLIQAQVSLYRANPSKNTLSIETKEVIKIKEELSDHETRNFLKPKGLNKETKRMHFHCIQPSDFFSAF